jgi:ribosomal protein S2
MKRKKSKVRLKRTKKKIISKKKKHRRIKLFILGIQNQLREPRLHMIFQIKRDTKSFLMAG